MGSAMLKQILVYYVRLYNGFFVCKTIALPTRRVVFHAPKVVMFMQGARCYLHIYWYKC